VISRTRGLLGVLFSVALLVGSGILIRVVLSRCVEDLRDHRWTWAYMGCVLVFAFASCALLTRVMIWLSFRLNVLDIPNARKIHAEPMPLLGGVAVFLSFLLTLVFAFHLRTPVVGMLLGGTLILVMGVMDDARGLSAKARLVGQVLAAAMVMHYGVVMEFIPGELGGRVMEVILTVLWIVGITNALNFLDGMDGLATGLAAISLASFLCIGIETHQTDFGFITAALLGSCLGFLVFNFKPASIFLGDSGSTFLGFSLASLAVMGTYSERDEISALFIPLLILGIIIYDVIFITFYRIKIGAVRNFHEWLEYTGKDHLHHRLSHLGLSERATVLFIYLLSIFMSIGAIVLVVKAEVDRFLVIIMALIVYILISVLMELGKKRSEW